MVLIIVQIKNVVKIILHYNYYSVQCFLLSRILGPEKKEILVSLGDTFNFKVIFIGYVCNPKLNL